MKKITIYGTLLAAFLLFTGCREATVQDVVSNVSRFVGRVAEQIRDDTSDSLKTVVFSNFDEALNNPDKVYHITVSNSNIDTLPKEIVKCENLESIDLSNNKFTEFPEELTEIGSLKYINLGRNKISKITDNVYKLTELSTLKLNDNKLESLPKALGYLPNLSELYLNDNKLTELPKEFDKLKQLNTFSIAFNKFDNIPQVLFSMDQLKKLDLSNYNGKISQEEIKKLQDRLKDTKIIYSNF